MDKTKINLILDRLLQKTKEGKLEWEKTADRNTFLLVLEDSAISVTNDIEYFSREGNYRSYRFDFRNEAGDIVESVAVSDEEEYKKAENIFNLARQQSFRTDKTVNSILEQLVA